MFFGSLYTYYVIRIEPYSTLLKRRLLIEATAIKVSVTPLLVVKVVSGVVDPCTYVDLSTYVGVDGVGN